MLFACTCKTKVRGIFRHLKDIILVVSAHSENSFILISLRMHLITVPLGFVNKLSTSVSLHCSRLKK